MRPSFAAAFDFTRVLCATSLTRRAVCQVTIMLPLELAMVALTPETAVEV